MAQPGAIEPTAEAKSRWYRRGAPAQLGDLAVGVWFMGHAQLFLAAAALLIGIVGVAVETAMSVTAGDYTSSGWLLAVLALPFAAAFLFSGLTLRAAAGIVSARATPTGRALTTTIMMVLIAAGAVVIAAVGIGAIIMGSFSLANPLT